MSAVTETVFPGKDNAFLIEVKKDGVLVDFTSATRYVLYMQSKIASLTIDTDIDGNVITGDSVGVLTFTLSDVIQSDQKGFYKTRLCVFDPFHPGGQVLISYCATNYPDLNINVC